MAEFQAAKIIRFEGHGEYVLAYDDKGQVFVTPAGRWDWRPFNEEPPKPPAPVKSRWRRAAAD
jgi:hypothetical protein